MKCCSNMDNIEKILNAAKNETGDILSNVNTRKDELIKNARELRDVKANELLAAVKLNEILKKNEEESKPVQKKKNTVVTVLAVFGVIAAVAAAAYGLYKYFTPDYLEDFDDDADEESDDDYFEDEDEEETEKPDSRK